MGRTGAILAVLLGLAIAPATASAHPMMQLGLAAPDGTAATAPVLPGSQLVISGQFVAQTYSMPARVAVRLGINGPLLGEHAVEDSGWFEFSGTVPSTEVVGEYYFLEVHAFDAQGAELTSGFPRTDSGGGDADSRTFGLRLGQPLPAELAPVRKPVPAQAPAQTPAATDSLPTAAAEQPATVPEPASQPVVPPARTTDRSRRDRPSRDRPASARRQRPARHADSSPTVRPTAQAPVITTPAALPAQPAPAVDSPRTAVRTVPAVEQRPAEPVVPGPARPTLETERTVTSIAPALEPPSPVAAAVARDGGQPWAAVMAITLAAFLGLGLVALRRRGSTPPPVLAEQPEQPSPTGDSMEAELQELLSEEHARAALERGLV